MVNSTYEREKLLGTLCDYFPSHSVKTQLAYAAVLRKLWKSALGRDELELFTWDWNREDDAKAWHGKWTVMFKPQLLQYIYSPQAALKPTTRRNYVNVLHVTYAGNEVQQDTAFLMSNLNREIGNSEGMQQRDQKEEQYGKSHEELLGIVSLLHDRLAELPAYQQARPMTNGELYGQSKGYSKLYDYLALASMVLQPPVRGDWGDVGFSVDDDPSTFVNNYVFDDMGDEYLMINSDKVSNKSGPGYIKLTDEFRFALNVSRIVHPRRWVFQSSDGSPLGVQNMTNYLRFMKHPNTGKRMNQGVQLLRSSYITWYYSQLPDHNSKLQLAHQMRHSWQTAEIHYNKRREINNHELSEFLDDVFGN